ncbi:MAG: hypothetical protein WCO09_04395 [bacterium]
MSADALFFQQNKTQTINKDGSLTLKGDVGKILTLNSCDEVGAQTSGDPKWILNVDISAATLVKYVDVRDSDASGGKQIFMNNSVNSGNTLNWVIPSSDATVTSAVYTISSLINGAGTITNVPYGTSKATLEGAITKGQISQTWNDTGIANTVVTGNTLVVTAQDGATIATYTITVNADTRSTDATITSSVYTVSPLIDGAGAITHIPYGTSKATLEAALTK